MERKHGPWTIKARTEKHRDEFITVYVDDVVRPDGEPGTYSTVRLKPGVSVLPVASDGTIYLARQFRYAVGAESIEAIRGGEEDEDAKETAKREKSEEKGKDT